MPKLTPRELAILHQQHRERTELRRKFERALSTLSLSHGYDLSVWSGREAQMEHTTQDIRDRHGVDALANLDTHLAELQKVRDELVDYITTRNGEIAEQQEEAARAKAAEDAEFRARYLTKQEGEQP